MAEARYIQAILDEIERLTGHPPEKQPKGTWRCKCPWHQDTEPSLYVYPSGSGRCYGACDAFWKPREFAERLGVDYESIPLEDRIISTYDYVDEERALLFQVARLFPKDFLQRRPDGKGGWIWNIKGVRRVLYRLPELLAAPAEEPVLVVEGEKDADRLAAQGFVATTNPGGAGKWLKEYSELLASRKVVIIPDEDQAGSEHLMVVASSLKGVAAEVRALHLPGLDPPAAKDVSDWFEAGHTAEELRGLVEKAPDASSVVGLHPDWPVPAGYRFPAGWEVSADGVFELQERKEEVVPARASFAPLLLVQKARDIDSGQEFLYVGYPREKDWTTLPLERGKALDSRQLIKAADYGVPVHSGITSRTVAWLAELERLNRDTLPPKTVATSCGWKRVAGEWVFLRGMEAVSRNGSAPLEMLTLDPGDRRHLEALTPSGTLEAWTGAMAVLGLFPRVLFSVYASFTPPLLRILGAPSFIIDLYGDTTLGKTATLEIAASVWGRPARDRGLVQSWDSTKVFAERFAALYNHLPIFLDDSQVADSRVISKTLYMLANEVGRGRGSPQGIRATPTWQTVAFSTGEAPLVEASQFGGARVRTISLAGSPFGSSRLGPNVRELRFAAAENYGHAGPLFLRYLLQHQEEWPAWKKDYQERISRIAETFPPGARNVNDRMATYFAAVEVAGRIAKEVVALPGIPKDITRDVILAACGLDQEADYATRSFECLLDFILSQRDFFKQDWYPQERRPPTGGWHGVWRDEFVAIFQDRVRLLLQERGYSYDSATRAWLERGWLKAIKGKRTYPVSLEGHHHKMLVVPKEYLGDEANEEMESNVTAPLAL